MNKPISRILRQLREIGSFHFLSKIFAYSKFKGGNNHDSQYFDRNPQHFMGTGDKTGIPPHCDLKERRGGMISNEKPPIDGKSIWAVVFAAAATALCAVIDLLLQGENPADDSE